MLVPTPSLLAAARYNEAQHPAQEACKIHLCLHSILIGQKLIDTIVRILICLSDKTAGLYTQHRGFPALTKNDFWGYKHFGYYGPSSKQLGCATGPQSSPRLFGRARKIIK